MPKIKIHASLQQESLTIASVITLIRFALIPPIVIAIIAHATAWAVGLFLAALLTDLLDGKVARMLKQETVLGGCLDRLADKLMVVSLVSAATYAHWNDLRPPVWFVVTVLFREACILAGVLVVCMVKGLIEVQQRFINKLYSNIVYALIALSFSWMVPWYIHNVLILVVSFLIVCSLAHHMMLGFMAFKMEAS